MKPESQGERPELAPSILQDHHVHAAGLLDSDDCANIAALHIFEDKAGTGRNLREGDAPGG